MLTTATMILAALVLAILAIAVGYVLGWANRAFHVEVDPKVEAIMEVLPGANCGGCGFVGCAEYAEAVAQGKADVTLCVPGGADCAETGRDHGSRGLRDLPLPGGSALCSS